MADTELKDREAKYECVYLHARKTGSEAKACIRKWKTFYNHQRPDSALGGRPPAVVYWLRKDETQPDQQVQGSVELMTSAPLGGADFLTEAL